tara:strand:- start:557 stop:778 length:222 start_codon:yes stop_codon:yes gene_type:complete
MKNYLKQLESYSEYKLYKEEQRLRELIQIGRERADIAIRSKLGRKALEILENVDARFADLKVVQKIYDKRFNI